MTPALTVAHPAGPLHRLGRRPDPWAWPDWAYAGPDGTFGNRYDDPESEFRVLYASSDRLTCFPETLARFRPDPEILATAIVADPRDVEFPTAPPGRVPVSWPENRVRGTIRVPAWPFVDVGTRASLAHLRETLAADLVRLGIADLDGATLRTAAPRTLTQRIARHVYDRAETTGVRYLSRLTSATRSVEVGSRSERIVRLPGRASLRVTTGRATSQKLGRPPPTRPNGGIRRRGIRARGCSPVRTCSRTR